MPSKTKHSLGCVFKLYPTSEQEELFRKTVGCCRFIYNFYLDWKNKEYQRYLKWQKRSPDVPKSKFVWKKEPTEKELKAKYEWLKEVNSQSLQQARKDLDLAFQRFFNGVSERPRFHKKGHKESFRNPQYVFVNEDTKRIYVSKVKWIKARGSFDPIKGKIKSVTVKLDADQWYASILQEVKAEDYYQPAEHDIPALGIDLGVARPVIISDGKGSFTFGIQEREHLKKLEIRRKRYQRQLARKQKGSNNRYKCKKKVAKAFQRERHCRHNWQHQVSNALTKRAEILIFEDLKLGNMTRSSEGTIEEPGKNVKQKSGLNREMLRLGLGGLVGMCQYKAHRRGGEVRFVDPKYTSQTCSDCGTVDKRSRESQSRFLCTSCGFKLNADSNAARNILNLGVSPTMKQCTARTAGIQACGETVRRNPSVGRTRSSVKQEAQRAVRKAVKSFKITPRQVDACMIGIYCAHRAAGLKGFEYLPKDLGKQICQAKTSKR